MLVATYVKKNCIVLVNKIFKAQPSFFNESDFQNLLLLEEHEFIIRRVLPIRMRGLSIGLWTNGVGK